MIVVFQLIYECKEVISAAIIGKDYYQDMTLSVLTADDKSRIDSLDCDINEFEEDVQSVLSVRFLCDLIYRISTINNERVLRTVFKRIP